MSTRALVLTEEEIRRYAENEGWLAVFASWRDTMLDQGRDIGKRTAAHKLSAKDVELDQAIAQAVVFHFMAWWNGPKP